MEKSFSEKMKTILERLGKCPLYAEVSLYMLKFNEDRLPIGGVCLV